MVETSIVKVKERIDNESPLGPLGPVRITPTEIRRPPHYSDESWREVRSATGVLLRALLLRL